MVLFFVVVGLVPSSKQTAMKRMWASLCCLDSKFSRSQHRRDSIGAEKNCDSRVPMRGVFHLTTVTKRRNSTLELQGATKIKDETDQVASLLLARLEHGTRRNSALIDQAKAVRLLAQPRVPLVATFSWFRKRFGNILSFRDTANPVVFRTDHCQHLPNLSVP